MYWKTLQHAATHCNTLRHTAKHCNTLQHTATHCQISRPIGLGNLHQFYDGPLYLQHFLQHTATRWPQCYNTETTTHCNSQTATHLNRIFVCWKWTSLALIATHCNTLTATHCNALTATHCNRTFTSTHLHPNYSLKYPIFYTHLHPNYSLKYPIFYEKALYSMERAFYSIKRAMYSEEFWMCSAAGREMQQSSKRLESVWKSPIFHEKRPVFCEKSPVFKINVFKFECTGLRAEECSDQASTWHSSCETYEISRPAAEGSRSGGVIGHVILDLFARWLCVRFYLSVVTHICNKVIRPYPCVWPPVISYIS